MNKKIVTVDVPYNTEVQSTFIPNYSIFYNHNVHQPMPNLRKIRYIRRVGSSNGINRGLFPVKPPVVPPHFVSSVKTDAPKKSFNVKFASTENLYYDYHNTNMNNSLKPHRKAPPVPKRSSSLQELSIDDVVMKKQAPIDKIDNKKKSKTFSELIEDSFHILLGRRNKSKANKSNDNKNKKTNSRQYSYVGENFVPQPNVFYESENNYDYLPPPPPELLED